MQTKSVNNRQIIPLERYDLYLLVLLFLCMIGGRLLGAAPLVIVYLGIGFLFFFSRFSYSIAGCVVNWPLLLYPCLGLISTVWSDYPVDAFRNSLQLLVTIVLFIGIVYTVPFNVILLSVSISMFVVLFLNLFSSNVVIISFTGEVVKVGIFGSKNNLATIASTAMIAGVGLFFSTKNNLFVSVFSIVCVVLSAITFLQAKSLGISASVLLVMGITYLLYLYSGVRITVSGKIMVALFFLCGVIMFLLVFVYLFNYSEFENFMYSIGKDPTLTGRTEIWAVAMESFWDNMLGGVGQSSYYQIDNPAAIEIWESHHKEIGAKFGFHSTYITGLIELGILGFLIIIALYVKGFKGIVRSTLFKMDGPLVFSTCMFLFIFSQTFLEMVGFAQFGLGTLMLCWSWIVLTRGTFIDQQKRIKVII